MSKERKRINDEGSKKHQSNKKNNKRRGSDYDSNNNHDNYYNRSRSNQIQHPVHKLSSRRNTTYVRSRNKDSATVILHFDSLNYHSSDTIKKNIYMLFQSNQVFELQGQQKI